VAEPTGAVSSLDQLPSAAALSESATAKAYSIVGFASLIKN
jgi:hypothetical protein